jgi:REP element-mobilizing transposase RayT
MRKYRVYPETTSIYFCTSTIVQWQCVFKEERYCQTIIDSFKYCREHKGLILYGFVIMMNHIHLMASSKDGYQLTDIIRDFKRHTSTQIAQLLERDNEKLFLYIFRKEGKRQRSQLKVWQDDYHPVAILSEKWFNEKMEYMHNNPVRKGYVNKPEDWKYSSARNWYFDDHSLITVDLD